MMSQGTTRNERGVVLALVAMLATVILGFLGLSLDVGQLHWTRVRAQTAADSAVLAALREQQRGGSFGDAQAAGLNDAGLNGFVHSADQTAVVVQRPTAGPLAGDSTAFEAVVTRTVPAMLLRFLGVEATTVSARAAARLGGGSGCIYALNKTEAATLNLGGSNQSYFSCDAIVESTHSGAFKMEGSGTLYMKNNAKVGVVGGWNLTGQTRVAAWPSGQTQSPVKISDPGDPFAGKPQPVIPTGPPTSASANDGRFDGNKRPPGGTAIPPGVYCGGMSIGNTHGATFTMSGLYIMAGGGLKINSQAQVTGSNVTILLTSGARSGVPGCTAAYDSFDISGQADVRLTAPVSGPQEGILIFQDRGIVSNADHKINGGSTTVFNGAVYVRNSLVTFSGNNSSGGYMILIADKIKITGNSTINADYSGLQHGSPLQTVPVLAE
jgi:Flp pilus assembly protein TadG